MQKQTAGVGGSCFGEPRRRSIAYPGSVWGIQVRVRSGLREIGMPSGKVVRIGKGLYYSCDEGCQAGGGRLEQEQGCVTRMATTG